MDGLGVVGGVNGLGGGGEGMCLVKAQFLSHMGVNTVKLQKLLSQNKTGNLIFMYAKNICAQFLFRGKEKVDLSEE